MNPERFMKYVRKCQPDCCWEWTGYRDVDGYGRPHVKVNGRWGSARANRISWELHRGPIPPGLHVLHRCDNPSCVRPDHLFLGTNLDNVHDRDRKGRVAVGEHHGNAKLTESQVREIRARRVHGESPSKLASAFNVDTTTIWLILKNRTWRHIDAFMEERAEAA